MNSPETNFFFIDPPPIHAAFSPVLPALLETVDVARGINWQAGPQQAHKQDKSSAIPLYLPQIVLLFVVLATPEIARKHRRSRKEDGSIRSVAPHRPDRLGERRLTSRILETTVPLVFWKIAVVLNFS